MEKELVCLENADQISPLKAFSVGTKAFCDNLTTVLKMCDPILYCVLSIVLMVSGCFCIINGNIMRIILGIILVVVAIYALVVGAWRFILARVAASYLAKDIFENKEIKRTKDYYSYVEQHTISYIKYWLWLFVVCIALCAAFFAAGILLGLVSPVLALIAVLVSMLFVFLPFNCGAEMSIYYWAYGDKSKPLDCLMEGIKSGFKHFWSIFVLFLVGGLTFAIITGIITVICWIIIKALFNGDKKIQDLILNTMQLVMLMFYYYFLSFVATRYYFSLIKKR